MIKLHIGCAEHLLLDNWINMDINSIPNVIKHDAREHFLYENNSVDFIFSEHFIEHLNIDEEIIFFKEAYRILKPDGVIRTSTFDIDDFLMHLHPDNENWVEFKNTVCGGYFKNKNTRIEFLSTVVYENGMHKNILNVEELTRLLSLSGFSKFNTPKMKESSYLELQNLEYRYNSTCIVEAIK